MQRQDQRRIFGNLQTVVINRHPLRTHGVNFLHQRPGIDDNAIADDRHLAAPHNARGQQAQFIDLTINDESVARVMPPLKTHNNIRALGQPVNDLALALVTPLGTNYRNVRHFYSVLECVLNQESFLTPSGARYCPHRSRPASASTSFSGARPATVFHPS